VAHHALVNKLARDMLADKGMAIIWKLHTDAARLYRVGNLTAAATFIEIADAAAELWLRPETVAGQ
jgi:hypothetical protein